MATVYVMNHLGLGDHIICLGLYRELAKTNQNLVIPVRGHNYESLKGLLGDKLNIRLLSFPKSSAEESMSVLSKLLSKTGIKELRLGHWGANFAQVGYRFDRSFYSQAQIPFEYRWKSFEYPRNYSEEKALFESYRVEPGKYVFLHEDQSRGFVINRNLLKSDLKVVEPRYGKLRIPIQSYRLLMENAAENHLIESSFAAFCESIEIRGSRTAHRYARPEALRNPFHEFTYLRDWNVLSHANSNKQSE
jgi:hypothetical protein